MKTRLEGLVFNADRTTGEPEIWCLHKYKLEGTSHSCVLLTALDVPLLAEFASLT